MRWIEGLGRLILIACVLGLLMAADVPGTLRFAGTGTAGTANANVITVQGIASGTTGTNALSVQGQAANAATAAGNPVAAAGLGVAKGSAPATITAGQAGALITDLERRLYVNNVHPNFTSANASAVTATTQVLGLSGAALSYYITDILLSCGATASTINVVSSTTAGNACATSPAVVIPTVPLAINGVATISFQTPIKVAANSALCCKTSGSTAFSCMVSGFIGP